MAPRSAAPSDRLISCGIMPVCGSVAARWISCSGGQSGCCSSPPSRARSGIVASTRPDRVRAAGLAAPSTDRDASPTVVVAVTGQGPETAPVSCASVPSIACSLISMPLDCAWATRCSRPSPPSNVAWGRSATIVRPVTPSCQVSRPDSTWRPSSTVVVRALGSAGDAAAAAGLAGRSNSQLPRPALSVSIRISGRTSVTCVSSTRATVAARV